MIGLILDKYKIKFKDMIFAAMCRKNQPCDVIKMREMRGEVGKKLPPPTKKMNNH